MFDTEKFIGEVQKWPAIYNSDCEMYNDKNAKLVAWDEVCRVMVHNWEELSEVERMKKEKNLRGRWRNIRDYFTKELRIQKMETSDRKRKRYTYFHLLQFLRPSIENKQRRENNCNEKEMNHCKIEVSDVEADNPMFEDYEMSGNEASTSKNYVQAVNSSENYSMMPIRYSKPLCETSLNSSDNEFQDMLSNNSQRTIIDNEDYDKMFLLSLLPILRQIPENKKLDVRIQMQQILAAVLYPHNAK